MICMNLRSNYFHEYPSGRTFNANPGIRAAMPVGDCPCDLLRRDDATPSGRGLPQKKGVQLNALLQGGATVEELQAALGA